MLPPAANPADTVIERTLACGGCGYDLKGLYTTGLCPECGSPVSASLSAVSLRSAAPAYLRSLNRGIILVESAAAFRVLTFVLAFFSSRWLGSRGEDVFSALASMTASLAAAFGWWFLTTTDLRRVAPEAALSPRRSARATALLLYAAWIIAAIISIAPVLAFRVPVSLKWAAQVAWLFLIIIQFFSEIDYYGALAARADDRKLLDGVRLARWLVPVGLIAFIIGGVVAYFLLLDSVRRSLSAIERARRGAERVPLTADRVE